MLQMFESIREILRPPMNPVFVKPVFYKIKESRKHHLIDIVIAGLNIFLAYLQQVGNGMHRKTGGLTRSKMHHRDRSNPRGMTLAISVVQRL